MRPSQTYDPELHDAGSVAASGLCSFHKSPENSPPGCSGAAVVSFEDQHGQWQAGCAEALEELVAKGDIAPLGQGA